MSRFRWYGPTLVLLITSLGVLLLTPALIRTVSWASTDATVRTIRNELSANPSLTDLSDAFKQVARAVDPSVVHIEIESRQRMTASPNLRGGPGGERGAIPPGFEDMFERFFGQDPRFRDRLEPQTPNPTPGDDYSEYNDFRAVANGSGWVYQHTAHADHAGNYIVTNAHVVGNIGPDDRIKVTFADRHEAYATIVGTDEDTDVAVLKLTETDNRYLHPAALGETPVEQGEIVFAFGSPFGAQYSFSMSQGIVSAVGRRVGIIAGGSYENFIQTDAAINPGNSGGPLVNTRGQVVGMNTAIASRTGTNTGIGFAIPVDLATSIADRLITDGTVQRGFLGVEIADLDDDTARTFGYDRTDGVLIQDLLPGSAAEQSDLRAGDIVTAVNGQNIADTRGLRFLVADLPPGQTVTLTVFRDGQTRDVNLTLGNRDEMLGRMSSASPGRNPNAPGDAEVPGEQRLLKFGITGIENYTPALARRFNAQPQAGVLVTDVRPGSVAAARDAGSAMPKMFRPTQGAFVLITQVGRTDIASVAELTTALNDEPADAPVRFTVKSWDPRDQRFRQRFVVLDLD